MQFSQIDEMKEEDINVNRKSNSLCLLFMLLLAVAIFSTAVYQQTPIPPPLQKPIDNSAPIDKLTPISLPLKEVPEVPSIKGNTTIQNPIKTWNEEWVESDYIEVDNIMEFTPIYAGEIHFPRIPREYWEHRLLSIKALGLNTLSMYIFWNLHEIERGKFDFTTGQRDLVGFLELSKKHGFKVMLRPGPYVCAEWDFGGLPARLLGVEGLVIRSNNATYNREVWIYFSALAEVIRPYLHINGGNIIMLQIENEFASLSREWRHTRELHRMWVRLNISVNFYNEDGYSFWEKQYYPGFSLGLSGGHNIKEYQALSKIQFLKDRLVMGGEIYTGWLTHWREKNFQKLEIKTFSSHIQTLLSNKLSFSLYMIHGGTNFALTAGANEFKNQDYQPHVTSYDYDSPINEQGSTNAKFAEAKRLFEKYKVTSNTLLPAPIKTISIPPIPLQLQASLMANLPSPVALTRLDFFESDALRMYHQGIVVYETLLPAKQTYSLKLMAHDYAKLFVDGELVGTIERQVYQNRSMKVECKNSSCVLRVLVEAMGHVNYGEMQRLDRKGLLYCEAEDGTAFAWKAYRLPLNTTAPLDWSQIDEKSGFPRLLSGKFTLAETGDTFFKLAQFGKGYVWVNGQLLGRYWNAGPQYNLFCPGVWLKEGENSIHVLELHETKATAIESTVAPS